MPNPGRRRDTMRDRKDALLEKTVALPAAGETAHVTFDLEQANACYLEQVVVEIDIPATTTLVATKTLTFKMDTAETVGNLDGSGAEDWQHVVTGVTNNGNYAEKVHARLPVDCKRIFRISCEAQSGAGNNTAKSFTVRLLV